MRRRQGPSKKLAPTNALEHACAHSYREDEGLHLEIDCMDCNGAHDLANRKCLAGVINALAATSMPEAIVLKRYTHKRYRGEAIAWIVSCAAELASLNRALTTRSELSDKVCRTCPASAVAVLGNVKRAMLEDPATYMTHSAEILKDIREQMIAATGKCSDAVQCIDDILYAKSWVGAGIRGR